MLDWVMEAQEAFCELEHIDFDFKSINLLNLIGMMQFHFTTVGKC